jgi:HAE1 family hydrophobic/amphiphilic exporter-1
MVAHGGFTDVDSSYRGGKPQIDVTLDRERAALLGVPAGLVAGTLRAFLGGDEVGTFRDAGDTYSIRLALPDAVRADPEALGSLTVRGASGALVELRNLTVQTPGEGPSQIDRSGRQREIMMLANLRQGMSLGEAMGFLNTLAQKELPTTVQAGFEGNAKELAKTGIAFLMALVLGMVLVYMILAAQFESLLDPIVIMVSLPFAIIGAIGGLLLTGEMLSMFAMIGVIMLMGLVVKNGILLVEFAVQLKHEEGKNTFDALVEAGRVRLRPILMTTIAMIAGMVPVALARGDGAETRVAMAVVIIGGLITSTVLTLGVVPVVYSLADGLRARFSRKAAAAAAPTHVVPAPHAVEPEKAAGPALLG